MKIAGKQERIRIHLDDLDTISLSVSKLFFCFRLTWIKDYTTEIRHNRSQREAEISCMEV